MNFLPLAEQCCRACKTNAKFLESVNSTGVTDMERWQQGGWQPDAPDNSSVKEMNSRNDPPEENDQSQGVDECGMYGITPCDTAENVSLERLGICRRYDPVHPSYATLESRMESFSCWPLLLKLRPEALSDAGFFYTGLGDRTICFQCGGGLKDWEESDDPWREHAKYFSKCSYVIQKKGRDYVKEVLGLSDMEVQNLSATSGDETEDIVQPSTSSEENSVGIECGRSDVGSSGYSSCGSFGEESSSSKFKQEKTDHKPVDDRRLCKICYAEELGVVFLPCGHLVSCVNCAPSLKTCAVCRKPFNATVRAYLS